MTSIIPPMLHVTSNDTISPFSRSHTEHSFPHNKRILADVASPAAPVVMNEARFGGMIWVRGRGIRVTGRGIRVRGREIRVTGRGQSQS